MKTCKSCGAPIEWIKTAAGKAMPCDAEQVYYRRNAKGKSTVITKDGETLRADIVDAGDDCTTGVGYLPHWVSCPAAKDFKGGGGR